MQHLAWIVVIFWVCHAHCCMYTDLRKEASEGSDVHLPCNFSSCPQTLDHRLSVEWEFNNTVVVMFLYVLVFFYANITVIAWPTLTFTGDIGAGDFSIVMHSVTCNQSGTYLCRSRSPDSPLIYKSSTQLIVTYNPAGNSSPPDENQERTISPDRGPMLRKALELSWMVGPVLLIALAVLGVLVLWRKRLFRWTAQRLVPGKSAPSGETCPPHQNQDIYVLCRAPTPHVSQEENIYMAMHPVLGDLATTAHCNRKMFPSV
nr:uncharacterized protein LOC111854952 isoform X2 [Paramormyrops kingsleyae]